jgi:hypothetical protein
MSARDGHRRAVGPPQFEEIVERDCLHVRAHSVEAFGRAREHGEI